MDHVDHMDDDAITDVFSHQSLASLRSRLLDLTGRNRLLNFRHNKSGVIRIIDESPNQLAAMILNDKVFSFKEIAKPKQHELLEAGYISLDELGNEIELKPSPTAREWAKQLQYNLDYDLAIDEGELQTQHQDTYLQTLLYPEELETQLRAIRAKANTAIEETGANILYMALGFLEWFDNDQSDVARLAPLFLIPVKIDKAALNKALATYDYALQYSGEDIVTNLSLREKLRHDFALALPDLDPDECPEDYFKKVAALIAQHQPRWSVKRFATLALFDFSKLLMYLDLDPNRWPQGEKNIQQHPIVRQFFTTTADYSPDSNQFGDEYRIDTLEEVHQAYPLIDDADSSQHSALIDVIKGQNLVIEGPPGTGKSQTITNLIAAAIYQGKKVLFVAEKMAALQVVKHRLARAGLADFCFELHSHNTQKKEIYHALAERIAKQNTFRYPDKIAHDIEMYEARKEQLNHYVELVNSVWQQTGKTIHDIFMAATRYRQQFPAIYPVEMVSAPLTDEQLTEANLLKVANELSHYASALNEIKLQLGEGKTLQQHPWFGVYNADIQLFETERYISLLHDWQQALQQLLAFVANTFNFPVNSEQDVALLIQAKAQLPSVVDNIDTVLLAKLNTDNHQQLSQDIDHFFRLKSDYQHQQTIFTDSIIHNATGQLALQDQYQQLVSHLNRLEGSIGELVQLVAKIPSLTTAISNLKASLAPVLAQYPQLDQLFILSQYGVTELKQFLTLLTALPAALVNQRDDLFDNDRLDQLLAEFDTELTQLLSTQQQLEQTIRFELLPSPEQLNAYRLQLSEGGFFRWFNGRWRAARRAVRSLIKSSSIPTAQLPALLDNVIDYLRQKAQFENNNDYQQHLKANFTGLTTRLTDLKTVRSWYQQIRHHYGHGFGKKTVLADLLLLQPTQKINALQHLANNELMPLLMDIDTTVTALKAHFNSEFLSQDDVPFEQNSAQFSQLQQSVAPLLTACQTALQTDRPIAEFADSLAALIAFSAELQQFYVANTIVPFGYSPLNINDTAADFWPRLRNTCQLFATLQSLKCPGLQADLQQRFSALVIADYQRDLTALEQQQSLVEQAQQHFAQAVKLDLESWLMAGDGSYSSLIIRNQQAIDSPQWLGHWVDFIRMRQTLVEKSLEPLLKASEKSQLQPEQLHDMFNYLVADHFAQQILLQHEELRHFSALNQNAIRQQFQEYDNQLKVLQREKIAWQIAQNKTRPGSSGGKVANYTEMALIQHEIGKKQRYLSVRELIKRASYSLQALKPCFMMGPNSVAQYLAPGEIEFDLVVMDEASQIKPEDALGTIARGKQVVIVGDPKQLPPTNFFNKMVEVEDDATAIEQSESILDVTLPMFNARRLRWHYRSRHESLIAFSNQAFYDSDLVIFPSPHNFSDEFGVKFTYVAQGCFVHQRNKEEADVVAAAVRQHLLRHPDESLGVVAMSVQQREQIERSIEKLAKQDLQFNELLMLNEQQPEPLFIKNLENVQGDERDVIFISFTYGPAKAGDTQMAQRFGPINAAGGGRRLNVLFTRSKKRMHAFSSMTEGHIQSKSGSGSGVAALKQFLAFAQTGLLNQIETVKDQPSTDFEIAIAEALAQHGFSCQFQVGVGGYFIDIAVQDPEQPGQFLMGIECDGATYHRAKSARDRDRLRQAVLENLGWRIKRIWSTDWFKNPQAQLTPIIDELRQLKAVSQQTDVADNIQDIDSE